MDFKVVNIVVMLILYIDIFFMKPENDEDRVAQSKNILSMSIYALT
jgi:hypothetical protein